MAAVFTFSRLCETLEIKAAAVVLHSASLSSIETLTADTIASINDRSTLSLTL